MSETPIEQVSNIIVMLSRNKKGDRDAAIFYLERLKAKLESDDEGQKPTSYEREKKQAPYPLTEKCHSCTRTRDYCYEHGIDFPDCYRPEGELSHLIPVPEMPGFVLNQKTCAMEPKPRERTELVAPVDDLLHGKARMGKTYSSIRGDDTTIPNANAGESMQSRIPIDVKPARRPKFKVGDRVRTTGNAIHCLDDMVDIGKDMEGVITHIDWQSVCVKFYTPIPDYNYESLWFRKKDCVHKKIDEKPATKKGEK